MRPSCPFQVTVVGVHALVVTDNEFVLFIVFHRDPMLDVNGMGQDIKHICRVGLKFIDEFLRFLSSARQMSNTLRIRVILHVKLIERIGVFAVETFQNSDIQQIPTTQ